MSLEDVTPIILAGGMGKRLRPLTSIKRGKPFVKFFSKNSFLQETLLLVKPYQPPVIVCHADQANLAFEQCYEIGIKPAAIICESAHRSTTAAVAAAMTGCKNSNIGRVLVLPCDQEITGAQKFYAAIREGLSKKPSFVLFGAKAMKPSTRYGYIQAKDKDGLHRFIEKPNLALARRLYLQKNTYWNTGMFITSPDAFLSTLNQVQPVIAGKVAHAMEGARIEAPFVFPKAEAYIDLPSIAVDYAVMENLDPAKVKVISLSCGWQDIGVWGDLLASRLRRLLRWVG